MAWLVVNNLHNQDCQLYDNDIDINKELALVNLANLRLPSKTSFINVVRKIGKKWLINNYINCNKIDLIIFIITNLEIVVVNYLEKSIVICLCQVSKVDQPNPNNMNKISRDSVHI